MKHFRAGMTIVELLVVIIVIGMLAGLGVFGYGRIRESAIVKQHKNSAENLAVILDDMYNTGHLPDKSAWSKGYYPSTHELDTIWDKITKKHDGIADDLTFIAAVSPDTDRPLGPISDEAEYIEQHYNALIYQPIDTSATPSMVCNKPKQCAKFNIYYFIRDSRGNYRISEPIGSKRR